MSTVKKGLGRGLDALFGDIGIEKDEQQINQAGISEVRITEIEPRADQPRKNFDEAALQTLAESIKKHGVIQPIILGERKDGFYPIIAGERRWRAAKIAGLSSIPAVIRKYEQQETAEVALIENLQRENLNPIEEAEGYKNLIEEFGLTQEQVSEKIGKSRSAIANTMRLLSLPQTLKQLITDGEISGGHARTLLAEPDENQRFLLAKRVIKEGLTVRELERIVNKKEPAKKPAQNKKSAEFIEAENQLTSSLGTKVRIINGGKKGKIEIEYYGMEDLDRIISLLRK